MQSLLLKQGILLQVLHGAVAGQPADSPRPAWRLSSAGQVWWEMLGGQRSMLPLQSNAMVASWPFLFFLILSKSDFKGGQAIEELDHLTPFIQRNKLPILLFCCWAKAEQVWNKAAL